MIELFCWLYLILQASRAILKMLGFSKKSWEEVFAPTFVLAGIMVLGLTLLIAFWLIASVGFLIIV